MKNTDLQRQTDRALSNMDDSISATTTVVTDLIEEIETLETDKEELENKIGQLEEEIETLKSQMP